MEKKIAQPWLKLSWTFSSRYIPTINSQIKSKQTVFQCRKLTFDLVISTSLYQSTLTLRKTSLFVHRYLDHELYMIELDESFRSMYVRQRSEIVLALFSLFCLFFWARNGLQLWGPSTCLFSLSLFVAWDDVVSTQIVVSTQNVVSTLKWVETTYWVETT